jgi:glucose/arabinose dehydrogenase
MSLRDRAPRMAALALAALAATATAETAGAQTPTPTIVPPTPTPTIPVPPTPTPSGPMMTDARLAVRPVAAGLVLPTSMAFIGRDDLLVLEKATGRVQRVTGGAISGTVLDLGVNSASERGLLGIALHPRFPQRPWVYLFWSCTAPAPVAPNTFQRECAPADRMGPDTNNVLATPLLGNRVDRFRWDGSALAFDRNIIQLRSFQNDGAPQPPGQGDEAQPPRGNHNGGVIKFGPDGKLYIQVGDTGRRGWMQNLLCGPAAMCNGIAQQDDQFGGPLPDDAHFTGVVIRLNDDGSAPRDNPFFRTGARIGTEIGRNIQKIFAYGLRNGFGMAFDHVSGDLWEQENGDDSFSELNRVEPGMNSGWVNLHGRFNRFDQYREIETSPMFFGLQQLRWPPTNLAANAAEAFSRLFKLPGSHFSDPEMSWKFEVAPGGIGFVKGRGLGREFEDDLFMGAAAPGLQGGHIFHFDLTRNRRAIDPSDPRLEDRMADNTAKYDVTESESLLVGNNFGVVTDIQTAPNGNLWLVSLTRGTIYEISRADR